MSSASNLRPTLAAALLAFACVVAAPAAARDSAPAPLRPSAKQTVQPEATEPTGAWAAASVPTDCTRARRKLWQADQGWIVKAITTCH